MVETQTVKPVNGFPLVAVIREDTERTWASTIQHASEPWWDVTMDIELYRVWLLDCVVEAARERRLEVRHGSVRDEEVVEGCQSGV